MRVIGIDPGSKACGYGIVEQDGTKLLFIDSGEIRPKQSLPIERRLHMISEEIAGKIENFSPACMSIEKVFVAKNSKSALHLGQARGAVLATAAACDVEVFEYSSTTVKKSVASNGRASKEEVQKMVSLLTGRKSFESSDESDAIAIAVCHINNAKAADKIPGFSVRKSSRRRRFTLR
ncbi:MAG: crossover junction endodeoxyribonuclease RuvC [Candidatus Mycalebacterium zealandia]|nr:MAG: crossover junction endodeoxyribonuclease RuvC [Candidatus Mycalebacterium zealandia]